MLSRRDESLLRAARNRKRRAEKGIFLAEGIRVVEALLEAGLHVRFAVASSPLEDTSRGQDLLNRLAGADVPLRRTSPAVLGQFADTRTPQPVLAVADIPRHGLDALHPPLEPAVLLLLDAVQDPGNLGTLLRTAEALGVAGVVALPGTVDPWNPKAVRAAAGASFRLPVVSAGWDELMPGMRADGYRILAADSAGTLLCDPPRRTALVVGNEGAGLSASARRHADELVRVHMRGRAESLNVAAAAAILLHTLLRP